MLNIALFGPPGAGKGTQASLLAKKYNLTYISTGEILRNEIKDKTEIGKEVKAVIERGELVDDETIINVIEDNIKMHPNSNGILFDGFPRTYSQAYILEGLLLKMNTKLSCLISLEVPRDILISRMQKRSLEQKRSDDEIEIIKNRLKEYDEKTLPVIDFFKEQGIFYKTCGLGSVEVVNENITDIIEKILAQTLLNIVFFGPPGAGKGTQAKKLAKKFNLEYISTGEMIRDEIEKQTDIGKIARPYLESGDIVPDDITIRLIEKKIKKSNKIKGFIFKGFPSTLVQAYILGGMLKKLDSSVSLVIELKTTTLQSIKRLSARAKTSKARVYDMDTDIIVHRLEVFEKRTKKVIDFYKKHNNLYSFDGNANEDALYNELCKIIDEAFKEIRK